jgi:hypothetical protein
MKREASARSSFDLWLQRNPENTQLLFQPESAGSLTIFQSGSSVIPTKLAAAV